MRPPEAVGFSLLRLKNGLKLIQKIILNAKNQLCQSVLQPNQEHIFQQGVCAPRPPIKSPKSLEYVLVIEVMQGALLKHMNTQEYRFTQDFEV